MLIENLSFSYDKKIVFKNFTCYFAKGKINTLQGPSGCGKTTLLRIIAGLEKNYIGSVDSEFAHNCSLLFQENRLLPTLPVKQQIECVSNPELAEIWLKRVSLNDEANKLCSELSGGMQRRLSLARCLAFAEAKEKPILLLDEPFTGVNKELIAEIVTEIKRTNKTIIMSAHDSESLAYSENEIHI